MALRIVANRPDPAVVKLPWDVPLEEWGDPWVVPLPRGLSRHTVRIVRLGDATYAVKETTEEMAFREYRLLRDLQRIGLPAVLPQGVVTGRETPDDEPLPAVLITRHLQFSLPYRILFTHGVRGEDLPSLVDAMVVLLVRLHLAGFYWGDVSLSNVLFRRAAGSFVAYLVDAETGELRPQVSDQMRHYDIEVGCQNIYAELHDLAASHEVYQTVDPDAMIQMLSERYDALWHELTDREEFSAHELWRIEQRIERLNDLGFDVEELDIVTDYDGDRVQLQPKVVELGHHRRELQSLTGLDVEDNQARRLLNDISAFAAQKDLGHEDRMVVANRWLHQTYDPIIAMVPPEARGKLEPAEIFHEILVHRWYLSERAGAEVSIFDTARDYIDTVLATKPDEVIASPDDELLAAEDELEPADDEE